MQNYYNPWLYFTKGTWERREKKQNLEFDHNLCLSRVTYTDPLYNNTFPTNSKLTYAITIKPGQLQTWYYNVRCKAFAIIDNDAPWYKFALE